MTAAQGKRDSTRSRIIDAAASLLREDGPAAVTTRAVAERAGVQPPAIYRSFTDKEGLLDAVAEHVMAVFVAAKTADVEAATAGNVDPLEDLREAWRSQIAFGLDNPALFRLLSDPMRVERSPAARSGGQVLATRVRRVAAIGRLRVSEPRAVAMIQAAGIGAIQTLLTTPPGQRDPGLAEAMYDAVLAQILTDPAAVEPSPGAGAGAPIAAAITMRALTPELSMLSPAERQLLDDWLARIVGGLQPPAPQRGAPASSSARPRSDVW